MPRTLFISDLHLAAERPGTSTQFFDFLAGPAAGADELYVLGDLFEAWIGDDELDAADSDGLGRDVAAGLRRLAGAGTRIHVMHGNRDFLLGSGFLAASGAVVAADPMVVEVAGLRTALLHGDTLCSDDVDYQAWRQVARSTAWQQAFLARPLAGRRDEMRQLRERSKRSIEAKPAAIMDVNAATVADEFRRHAVRRMIHGHTHRPARHDVRVDGTECERWVLPDWYGSGGYLAADGLGLRMLRF